MDELCSPLALEQDPYTLLDKEFFVNAYELLPLGSYRPRQWVGSLTHPNSLTKPRISKRGGGPGEYATTRHLPYMASDHYIYIIDGLVSAWKRPKYQTIRSPGSARIDYHLSEAIFLIKLKNYLTIKYDHEPTKNKPGLHITLLDDQKKARRFVEYKKIFRKFYGADERNNKYLTQQYYDDSISVVRKKDFFSFLEAANTQFGHMSPEACSIITNQTNLWRWEKGF